MALLYMDSFSTYTIAQQLRKWTARTDVGAVWAIGIGEGRIGNALVKTSTTNDNGTSYLLKAPTVRQNSIWSAQPSGICAFAIKVDDLGRLHNGPDAPGGNAIRNELLSIWYGNNAMTGIGLNADGTISVVQPNGTVGGTPLFTTINAVNSGSWAFLEFKWVLHETTGSLVIRANGIEIHNYSGRLHPNTYPYSDVPNLWTSIRAFAMPSSTPPYLKFRVCDFHLMDLSGAFNNDFQGDVSVAYITTDADGAVIGWTPSLAPNFSCVNDVPADDDVRFVAATTPGLKDLYSFQPITLNPRALQHCIMARRAVPGSATLQSIYRQGGIDYPSLAQAVQNETYAYNLFPYDINPATGARYTFAEVNGNEFGGLKET